VRPLFAQDVPKVLKGKAWPALVATGRVMGVYGATFAAIGGIFAAVDVRALRPAGRSSANPRPEGAEQGLTRARAVSTPQCVAEGVRGKKDFWNGVMGGAAAGSVIGVRGALRASAGVTALSRAHTARLPRANPAAASLPYGVAAAAALAATSAVVDSTGQNLRGAFGVGPAQCSVAAPRLRFRLRCQLLACVANSARGCAAALLPPWCCFCTPLGR